ncbi:PHB depolymerase family esterase [Ramlibacter solisilvae]|uniref:Poly(3-hydroxyalkanoate) depolymerase n=1 Tax=Ramlibacter tataouinensis TaxID=94132 RepID=A0A127JW09_9BURK|nr:PHB depolymerase family esterase [Ramlibacter tataouinensis]AMO24063.1 poly(3-hydroxyalkanoate) depolymerase [Ramlibacter tataouinensis]
MQPNFQQLMQDATRLVRAGDLAAATAAIQAALNGSSAMPVPASRPTVPGDIVLDVEAREIKVPAAEPKHQDDPGSTPSVAEGVFISGRCGDGRTERDYKLYVPPQAGERPLPLVVMLHGCTQDPDDFAAGTRMNQAARAQGCFVLYPAQSRQANPQRCWNWFKHSHQQRGRGEASLLAAMTRHVMARHDIDPARVYVAGLSAGGAMATILGTAYPDLYAAVGVHSGLACGAAKDLPSALAAMRSGGVTTASSAPGLPTIVFHGDADATVHPDNGRDVVRASAGGVDAEPEARRHEAAGGRSFTRHLHRSVAGEVLAEHWVVHGSGHAWSGGSRNGTYTDPTGPDATQEMLRFFLEHPRLGG